MAGIFLITAFFGYADGASVPVWVKNNAGWWSSGQIDDQSFVSGVKFLIEEGIITVPSTTRSVSTSDSIPDWVKNTAGWWSNNEISENDFLNAIQYLIKTGTMSVSADSVSDDMGQPSQYQPPTSESTNTINKTGDNSLDQLLVVCQSEENPRLVRDCEKAIKEDYNLKKYKSNSTSFQVGPITYYYATDWQEEIKGVVKQYNNISYTATGQALLNLKLLAENTGSSSNVTMTCTSPSLCNYNIWDGGHKWVNSGSDFTSGNVVLKEGQNRFLNILWGPAIGYGSYEDFLYDSGKDYSLRIQEPFGSLDLPLNLVVVP
ncbi:MAG: peptidase [Thaumarchaeota archaeon]|nr:peptidase [Nitrososphaerota archaeon]